MLILAGVVLFVALILEIIRMATRMDEPVVQTLSERAIGKSLEIKTSGNVFDNIHKQYSSPKDVTSSLVQRNIPFSSHNYVIGNPKAKVKIVIFNDNDCNVCRHELTRVTENLKPLLQDVLVIYKHMPANQKKDSLTAIFGQMAIRKGVYENFLETLTRSNFNKPAQAEDYLVILESIGVSLKDQRAIMIDGMADIMRGVQDDIIQAKKAGAYSSKGQPVIYLNGYQLGDKFLPERKMMVYISRLLKGEFIIPKSDSEVDGSVYIDESDVEVK